MAIKGKKCMWLLVKLFGDFLTWAYLSRSGLTKTLKTPAARIQRPVLYLKRDFKRGPSTYHPYLPGSLGLPALSLKQNFYLRSG